MVATSFYLVNRVKHCYPEVVAYYYKEWQNFQMSFHSHEAIEMMYVISGECHVELKSECVSLKKGQFIWLSALIIVQ